MRSFYRNLAGRRSGRLPPLPPPLPAGALRKALPRIPRACCPLHQRPICLARCFPLRAALALAARPAASEELGPLCAGLAQQLGFDPKLVGSFIDSQPVIPSRGFCPWYAQHGA